MKLSLIFALVICAITGTHCDKDLTFKYDGIDWQTSLPNYFDIAINDIEPNNGSDTVFLILGYIEQKVDLDDQWKWEIRIFRSDTEDGEYSEYFSFPEIGSCAFMKTIYKNYVYPTIKECSNFPHPDTCPIVKEKYHTKCKFDASVFLEFSKPGFYKFYADLYKNGNHETGIVLRGSVHEK